MATAEPAKADPTAFDDEEDRQSGRTENSRAISFADDTSSRPSFSGRTSVDSSRDSRTTVESGKSGKSLRFDETASFPSRSDSGFSQPVSSRFSDTDRYSHDSAASAGAGSVRSVSQYTNADGVSVDLAGRGLAGLNIGATEFVATQQETGVIKPERPSGLLAVHSSKYESMRGREPIQRKETGSFKKSSQPAEKHSGSRSISGSRHSRTSSASDASRASGRLSQSGSLSKHSSRRSSSKRFFDDEPSVRDSFASSRNSDFQASSRASGMGFAKRASALMKRQSSFKDAQEVKSEFFGEEATVHTLNKKALNVERVDPDDIQLDVYVNDLEFANDHDEFNEEDINATLFYKYELVTEPKRLFLVKWLVTTHTEKELRNLSIELGDLLDQTPKVMGSISAMDEEQAKDVVALIQETDKAIRGQKQQELEQIYQQRLQSVVEALVMRTHMKAEEDLVSTTVIDQKGKDLLDINREDMHLRFYDTYDTTIEIGEGHLSRVFLCNVRDKPADLFAVKIVNKQELSKQRLRYLKNECDLANKLSHPCIVKTFDVFDHWDYAFIVMEYISGGTLLEILRRDRYFEEEDAKRVMFDILRAVAFLHKNNVIHRDLKFDNVLCTESELPFQIKIADFGLAHIVRSKEENLSRVPRTDNQEAYMVVKKTLDKEKAENGEMIDDKFSPVTDGENAGENGEPVEEEEEELILTSAVGTPAYAAPELLKGHPYSYPVDLWASGVILYGMLSGSRPFSGKTPEAVLSSIQSSGLEFPKREWYAVSDQARSLCRAMLEPNPEFRVTADEAMRHTWFNSLSTSFN